MDVYTTSFNVYPFAVPPPSSNPSYPPVSSSFNQQHSPSYGSGSPSPGPGEYSYTPAGMTPTTPGGGAVVPSASSTTGAGASAVHRHHSTNSGVEAVWDHLHRLTLQAMQSYPGTHISFSRTASASSSQDSLALLNTANSSSSTSLNSNGIAPSSSSSSPMLTSTSNGGASGGGVISANANAALLNGPHTRGTAFNFTITGSSQANVMAARGLILRESPVQNRSVIRVARSEILEPASASIPIARAQSNGGSNGNISSVPMPTNGGGGGALKQPVIQRLDEIAAQTRANISVLKTSSSSSSPSSAFPSMPQPHFSTSSAPSPSPWPTFGFGMNGGGGNMMNGHSHSPHGNSQPHTPAPGYPNTHSSNPNGGSAHGHGGLASFGGATAAAHAAGLEGEKTCELIITGPGETVDVARLRLLVMLDELVRHFFSFVSFHYFSRVRGFFLLPRDFEIFHGHLETWLCRCCCFRLLPTGGGPSKYLSSRELPRLFRFAAFGPFTSLGITSYPAAQLFSFVPSPLIILVSWDGHSSFILHLFDVEWHIHLTSLGSLIHDNPVLSRACAGHARFFHRALAINLVSL